MCRDRFVMPAILFSVSALVAVARAGVQAIFNVPKAQQLREQIANLADRAQAIVDLASRENRDLSADEKTEIDSFLGVGKPGEADYKPGQIDQLERELARAEKLEARMAELAAARSGTPPQRADGPVTPTPEQPAHRLARVTIPAQARVRHAGLKAFRGEYAEQTAYAMGQFVRASLGAHPAAQQWCAEHGLDIRAALSGADNGLGGFLVPEEMEQAIIDLREQYGVFRQYAQVVPMSSDTKNQPYRKSGITAYFVGDNQEITASDKQWGNAQLVARKLGALIRCSSELNEDAVISIADDLAREIAYAFAVKEDACGFNGDGTSTYGGVVGLGGALAAGSIHDALSGNVGFTTLDLADFEAAIGKLPMYQGIQPRWFISQVGYWNSMARLMDAAGGNTITSLSAGPGQLQFLGYPVVISQALPTALTSTTSTILAYFGDLRLAALLGNRRGVAIALSDQRYFEYDQIGVKGTERFDLVIHSKGDASSAGAIVALKTAAS